VKLIALFLANEFLVASFCFRLKRLDAFLPKTTPTTTATTTISTTAT